MLHLAADFGIGVMVIMIVVLIWLTVIGDDA